MLKEALETSQETLSPEELLCQKVSSLVEPLLTDMVGVNHRQIVNKVINNLNHGWFLKEEVLKPFITEFNSRRDRLAEGVLEVISGNGHILSTPIVSSTNGPVSKELPSELIKKAQLGDQGAFSQIYIRYQDRIYNYVYRMMGNPEDALDFTQETFMKAYCAFPQTSHDLRVGAWIYRIATNTCLDELRHRRLIKWQSLYAQPENLNELLQIVSSDRAYNPEGAFLDKENSEEIQATLDRLHPKYRVCLILREYQGLSYDEIAEVLKSTRAAVKSLLFRAREEFRQVYARTDRKPVLQAA